MIFGIVLLLSLWLIYKLFYAGYLFRLVISIFGWYGLFIAIGIWFPKSAIEGIIVSGTLVPWCAVIPTIIILLAMASTKVKE